ncbi:MAG: glycoside hydrolase family 3 C-terminal domain-containing protein [Lachnospiraceae bacterium]|nr:glycoside hydrolase family 3 C-terminal domain-containing protein [Lachnospiraceae bacterium]
MELQEYERIHSSYLRENAAECTVLLKKDGGFPLSAPGKIAVYGSGVRHTVKGGIGSGEVNSRYFVTVEQGLENAGFSITSGQWLDGYDREKAWAKDEFKKALRQEARQKHTQAVILGMGRTIPEPEYELPVDAPGDTAVYVLSRISGEGSDRRSVPGDVKLTETEIRDILACNERYAHFMLVLNVGGVVDLSPVSGVKNILLMSQLGVESGNVLADILLGKAYPSGKLASTWCAWEQYPSVGTFGELDDTRYREGIYVGYRYFDSVGETPLYPFGFGLSFTEFAISPPEVRVEGKSVFVRADVKNTGRYPGKEVVQVYISVPAGKLDQPYQTMTAFGKTNLLDPGESQLLELSFDLSDSASFDEKSECWILEKGDYIVRVGNSSRNTFAAAVLELGETVITRKTINVLGKTDFEDFRPEAREPEDVSGVSRILLDAAMFPMQDATNATPESIDEAVKTLPDEELIKLCLGSFDPKGGVQSMIGNAAFSVAGAAGQTSLSANAYGIPSMVMADGPAGLRISPAYYENNKGVHALNSGIPESIMENLPPALRLLEKLLQPKPGKKDIVRYHYATALPIGTAIAQSFNTDFARGCGDIVGSEMAMFGVQLWLAPAMNIHRSVLCGRNFEYYSEDPLISGRMAAAVTAGVQQHPGCGVTVKHYCANNQETNRYQSNSMVSERTMREIYLRGYGICVRESQPMAVMTSYNLLNGRHTSEHPGLIRDILRSEFGFRGIIMTDWVVANYGNCPDAKYPVAHAPNVAAAGGDLFMPGSLSDYREMSAAFKDGTLTREMLEENVSRIVRMARQLCF